MNRPSVNSVTWDYFHYNHTPDFSYRVEMARQHPFDYFRLRYIKGGQDKIKLFYGELAWSDLERFVHDLGDWGFSVDKIRQEMIEFLTRTILELPKDEFAQERELVAQEDRTIQC